MSVWVSPVKLEAAGGQRPCFLHSSSISWVFHELELISVSDRLGGGVGLVERPRQASGEGQGGKAQLLGALSGLMEQEEDGDVG